MVETVHLATIQPANIAGDANAVNELIAFNCSRNRPRAGYFALLPPVPGAVCGDAPELACTLSFGGSVAPPGGVPWDPCGGIGAEVIGGDVTRSFPPSGEK